MRRALGTAALLVLLAVSAAAQPGPAPSATFVDKTRSVSVPVVETPPSIDGRLDEDAWTHAALLGDFVQTSPGDNTPPSRPTEVLVCRDARNLYVAFRAHDDRGSVRATLAARDDISSDDYVGMYLDTFGDRRKAYALFFNPFGIQRDALLTAAKGLDYSVDVVLESQGVVGDDGYTVEVALPFKSFRFALDPDTAWGVHFVRGIRRFDDEVDSWMPLRRDVSSLLAQAGQLTGFAGVEGGHTLDLIPSLTLSEAGERVASENPRLADRGRTLNRPAAYELGLTLKYTLSSGVTASLAINPDFAQVEADETVVTGNQRFPIYYAEKRPFFLEGIDVFQTPLNVVHTRTIVDPDVAANLSGKVGRSTFGLLLASDAAPGNFSRAEREDPESLPFINRFLDRNALVGIIRVKEDFGAESSVGLIATARSFVDDHNHVAGIDGRFRLDDASFFTFQGVGTLSRRAWRDPYGEGSTFETRAGFGYSWRYDRTDRHSLAIVNGEGRTDDFRADVGFTQRVGTNLTSLFYRVGPEPHPSARLISWNAHLLATTNFDWQARMQDWYRRAGVTLSFAHRTSLTVDESDGYTRLFEADFGNARTPTHAGAFYGPDGERSSFSRDVRVSLDSAPNAVWSFGASYRLGRGDFDYDFGNGPRFPRVSPVALGDPSAPLDPGRGRGSDLDLYLDVQPLKQFSASLAFTRSRLTRDDTGRVALDEKIATARATYKLSRFTSIRLRADYDALDGGLRGQVLFGWAPNPGTSIFFGFNEDASVDGFSPFTGRREPGLRLNGRTFFFKTSYLIRKGF